MIIDKEALAEVEAIVNMMPEETAVKIPKELKEFLRARKSVKYIPDIRKDIPLYQQSLKEDTRTMCSLIYRKYLCTEEQKIRLEEKDNELLMQRKKERAEIYNFNEILKKNQVNKTIKVELEKYEEKNNLVEYRKQGWIKNFFNKILSCFRKY